jgi:hypothetical protein
MTSKDPIESMNLAQLREAAAKWHILNANHLTKTELVPILLRAKQLKGKSLTELRNMAGERRISGADEMRKQMLVRILLNVGHLEARTVAELRALARGEGMDGTQRLKKADLIQQLLRLEEIRRPVVAEAPVPEIVSPKPRGRLMKIPWRRWLGNAIRLSAGMSVVCCLVAMLLICFLPAKAAAFADEVLEKAREGVHTTISSLEMVIGTIEEAVDVLEEAAVSLIAVGDTIEGTEPMIESLGVLVGEKTPATIESTREALISAEEGARAIDQVLRGLARLSLLTGITYDPDQPLDEGIAEVAASLEPLPAALEEVHEDMGEATGNLAEVSQSLGDVSYQLDQFVGELGELKERLVEFSSNLEARAQDIDAAAERVPALIWVVFAVCELFLLWVILGQCALFFMGDQMRKVGAEQERISA